MIQLLDSTPIKETSLVLIHFYIEFFESKYIHHFSVSILFTSRRQLKEKNVTFAKSNRNKKRLSKLDTFFSFRSQSQKMPAEDYVLSTSTSSFVPLGDSFVSNS